MTPDEQIASVADELDAITEKWDRSLAPIGATLYALTYLQARARLVLLNECQTPRQFKVLADLRTEILDTAMGLMR